MDTIQFASLWQKLTKEMKIYMEEQLSPHLTESQLHVLELLMGNDSKKMKPSDFIDYLSTTPAAVTTLLDRMERNKLIERERDVEDRRKVWVFVSKKGKEEWQRGMEIREKYVTQLLNRISTHNQQLLIYLLGKVANY